MQAAAAIPQITEFREVDATALESAVSQLRSAAADGSVRVGPLPVLVRAVIVALRRHPQLNATLDMEAERFEVHHRRHVSIAVATDQGLIAPVLRDAAQFSFVGLARQIGVLSNAARTRSLTVDQVSGGTFTISNFGSYGTWLGTPLVNPPQVAIAGFGRIRDAVVAAEGVPVVRRLLPVAVSADHRLIDGHQLGAFVATLEQLITSPMLLLGEVD
jgi:pyruvate/2-oxoglutarate dehydrogenase complex dihydrolipoamide acyltransferase (E2) component